MLPMFRGIRKSGGFRTALLVANGDFPFVPNSVGAAVGDLLVVVSYGGSTPISSGGAFGKITTSNGLSSGDTVSLFWRVLTQADMSSSISGALGKYAIYRGPTTVTKKVGVTGVSPLTAAGFAPAAGHKGMIALISSVTSGAAQPTLTAPSGLSIKSAYSAGWYGAPTKTTDYYWADYPSPPNKKYSGQSVTGASGSSNNNVILFELT